MSDFWGESDPRGMPPHFFQGTLHLEYDSAVRADVANQNYTMVPRYWYVDATMRCDRCGYRFLFSAVEQKAWYEDYGFYVDAFPKHCRDCRRELRDLKAIRQEYDRDIARALASDDCVLKNRLVTLIDRLCEFDKNLPAKVQVFDKNLPAKVHENRRLLAVQIARRNKPTEP